MTRIRIPYVKEYTDPSGRVRRYYRRRGCKPVPLPGVPGSAEFMAAYAAAMGEKSDPKQRAPGSFGALVSAYYQSVAFTRLKPSSRKLYRHVLEPLVAKHGHRAVRDMRREHVERIVGEIGARAPGMANLTRAVLHKMMRFAVKTGWRSDNPVEGVESYTTGHHHTWTDAELATYEKRWPIGTRERLAYALLLHTGQRGGDVVRMLRSDIVDGRIRVTQEKHGAELLLSIRPELRAALKAGPTNIKHLIAAERGKPMKRQALTDLIRRAAAEAGLPPRCKAHGLRKAMMRRLAEHGRSSKEIAAVSGHRTLKEVELYTEAASQTRLADSALSNSGRKVSNRSRKPIK